MKRLAILLALFTFAGAARGGRGRGRGCRGQQIPPGQNPPILYVFKRRPPVDFKKHIRLAYAKRERAKTWANEDRRFWERVLRKRLP